MSDLFQGNRGFRQSRDVPRAVVVHLPSLRDPKAFLLKLGS
jgi:hypothetical protein